MSLARILRVVTDVVVGGFLYSVAWSFTLNLFNKPSNIAVITAVVLTALLIGIGIWIIFKAVEWLYRISSKEY